MILIINFFKKAKYKVAPHITHLISSILITSKYPDIYKISRILPLSKPDKDKQLIEGYRPISNLCAIEKVIETYLIHDLNKFFTDNDILDINLNGGRKDHSPQTAILNLYNTLHQNLEMAKWVVK